MADLLDYLRQSPAVRTAEGKNRGLVPTSPKVAIYVAFLVPVVGIMWLAGTNGSGWSGAWKGLICALAPLALGWVVGFLFGLPQIPKGSPGDSKDGVQAYAPGGHLEAISDWLTKIIVGVGLVQWNTFMVKFWGVAELMSRIFGRDGNLIDGKMIAACALVYFGLLGLLAGYLTTRLYLASLIVWADRRLNRPDPSDVEKVNQAHIDQSTGELQEVDPGAAAALVAFPMSSFITPKALSAWGKAKLFLGDRASAITALGKAIDLDKKDPTLRRDLAALIKAQDPVRASQLLFEAADIKEDPVRLASRMLVALYKDPPIGFTDVISTLDSRIKTPPYKDSADLHAYLSCAYGQKAAYDLGQQSITKPSTEFTKLKDLAYDHASQAINLGGATWKPRLAAFLHPQPGSPDDDLKDFGDDPGFNNLVG